MTQRQLHACVRIAIALALVLPAALVWPAEMAARWALIVILVGCGWGLFGELRSHEGFGLSGGASPVGLGMVLAGAFMFVPAAMGTTSVLGVLRTEEMRFVVESNSRFVAFLVLGSAVPLMLSPTASTADASRSLRRRNPAVGLVLLLTLTGVTYSSLYRTTGSYGESQLSRSAVDLVLSTLSSLAVVLAGLIAYRRSVRTALLLYVAFGVPVIASGDRSLLVGFGIAVIVGYAASTTSATPRRLRRATGGQSVRRRALLIGASMLGALAAAQIAGSIRSDGDLSIVAVDPLIRAGLPAYQITADLSSATRIPTLEADLIEGLPPPLDRAMGSSRLTGTLAYRERIGLTNPNSGVGMSLVGELLWNGGPLLVALGGAAIGATWQLVLQWARRGRRLAPGVLISICSVYGYSVRNDMVVLVASLWIGGAAAALFAWSFRPLKPASREDMVSDEDVRGGRPRRELSGRIQ